MSRIDVVHAANMKPGDLFAGQYVPDAPTRPVQPWAAAHKLTSVTPYTDENGRHMMRFEAGGFTLTPTPAVAQCLVINLPRPEADTAALDRIAGALNGWGWNGDNDGDLIAEIVGIVTRSGRTLTQPDECE